MVDDSYDRLTRMRFTKAEENPKLTRGILTESRTMTNAANTTTVSCNIERHYNQIVFKHKTLTELTTTIYRNYQLLSHPVVT